MAAYNKFEDFTRSLCANEHGSFAAAGDVLKVYLTNNAPSASLDAVKADLAESVTGTGYTAGGEDTQNDLTESPAGTANVTGVDIVWTAGAGDWTAFRYAVLYNDTPTAPADPLIAWWDYGSSITLGNGETFTVDFGTEMFSIT